MEVATRKRIKTCNERPILTFSPPNGFCYGNDVKETCPRISIQSDPFALPMLLEELADGKYGSVTREYEAIRDQNMQMMNVMYALRYGHYGSDSSPVTPITKTAYPVSSPKSALTLSEQPTGNLVYSRPKKVSENASSFLNNNVRSSCNSSDRLAKQIETNDVQIIVIDSDDETEPSTCLKHETEDKRDWQMVPFHQDQLQITLPNNINSYRNRWQPSVQFQKVLLTNNTENGSLPVLMDEKQETNFSFLRKLGASSKPQNSKCSPKVANSKINNAGNINEKQNVLQSNATENAMSNGGTGQKSPYVESTLERISDSDSEASELDGLDDLWKDMSLAMECSKSVIVDVPTTAQREEQECDHLYFLKDDMGLVCRLCGIIGKSIENIFDYQWVKGSRMTRTYIYEPQNTRDNEKNISFSGLKSLECELLAAEIAIHPRHRKQMKPHQLEGFSFLVRNLVSNKPGGCILAHAPGSGKTFMLISFIQSFLSRYSNAKPLIILPKGILPIWKREFEKWQVEDIPLYDPYSNKADVKGRSHQLEVFKKWVEEKSILFLGYTLFSNIVCDDETSFAAVQCREILLKCPGLLIIDEGHTPRNDNTDVLQSLAKIQTPRKVVLSGTLYQNNVKEVFNILNLVCPNFLKLDTSRTAIDRIKSRVRIEGIRRPWRADSNAGFFELVEDTLQNEDDFKRKSSVIRDLREMTKEVLHYYKGDFLEELPGLVDFTVFLKMSPKQKTAVTKLGKMYKFKKSSLCQSIYMHPYLREVSENSTGGKNHVDEGKIDSIIERLDVNDGIKTKFFLNILSMAESAGERVLVFSKYILPLKFLERLLTRMKGWRSGKEMFTITGEFDSEQRELAMEQINNSPDAKILFGSIKACGEGISLVGASRVIILDVHLNPSVSRQAIGRAFRPGQTKKVYVYRLVAADSMEEEDHKTSFGKDLTSKMWFEWNGYRDDQEFELDVVDIEDSEDMFFENPCLKESVKCLYRRLSTF